MRFTDFRFNVIHYPGKFNTFVFGIVSFMRIKAVSVKIFLQHLTPFLTSHLKILPQFLQWCSFFLFLTFLGLSSFAFPSNVFAHQAFSVVLLSFLVLSRLSHPLSCFHLLPVLASHCHISVSPVPSSMACRNFRLEVVAVFLLLSSISLSYTHLTFLGHLISLWASPQNICSFLSPLFLFHHPLPLPPDLLVSSLSFHSFLVCLPCCYVSYHFKIKFWLLLPRKTDSSSAIA